GRAAIRLKEGPQSFVAGAGMVASVPPGAWRGVRSPEGMSIASATLPGAHGDVDVVDPRPAIPDLDIPDTVGPPTLIDLGAELAPLTMFRGRTPQSTMADRAGSSARLAAYRDGGLFVTKFAGTGHWEAHLPGDELVYIIDGTATLQLVLDDGPPQSFALGAGTMAVNPQGAWHRFHSSAGVTLLTATPSPSEIIELDVDDPRTVARA